jgi:hypothetical protein
MVKIRFTELKTATNNPLLVAVGSASCGGVIFAEDQTEFEITFVIRSSLVQCSDTTPDLLSAEGYRRVVLCKPR